MPHYESVGGFTGESWEAPLRRLGGEDTDNLKGRGVGGNEKLTQKSRERTRVLPESGTDLMVAGCRQREDSDGLLTKMLGGCHLLSLRKWNPAKTSMQRMSWFCWSVKIVSTTKDQEDQVNEKDTVPDFRNQDQQGETP